LVPELPVLEYMKRLEKYLNRKVVPLKTDVASFASRYQMSVANIKETQANYIEDVRCIHKLCDIVARLPEERRRRNEERIKTDLTALVNQSNPKEDILIKAKEEFEGSILSIKDKVRDIALTIKKVQIDTTEQDYEMMVKADLYLIDLVQKLSAELKQIQIKIEQNINLGFINNHKRKIEDEFLRRDGGQNYLYNSAWKPFQSQIQMFDSDKDTEKVQKMYNSFKHLIESIEWSFDAENQEYHYLNILANMQRMHGIILSKRQEIEYTRIRADDCAHPLTREFILFYQKVIGNLMSILADAFYGNPLHKVLIDVLQVRNQFFEQLKLSFLNIKIKFKESKENYYIGEYWENLGSMIYDFMERVYTNNVHQKLRISESIFQIVVDFRDKIEYLSADITNFYANLDEGVKLTNLNYQKLMIDSYNDLVRHLKVVYTNTKIEEGYCIEFEKEFLRFSTLTQFMYPNHHL
jgi:hypothetical protein